MRGLWVVCARVADPGRLIIAGQIEKPCTGCDEPVAISPSGQAEIARDPRFQPWCSECFVKAVTPTTICRWAVGATEERSGLAS
jgi:hypothetical protein